MLSELESTAFTIEEEKEPHSVVLLVEELTKSDLIHLDLEEVATMGIAQQLQAGPIKQYGKAGSIDPESTPCAMTSGKGGP
jgi:hypothetical protein